MAVAVVMAAAAAAGVAVAATRIPQPYGSGPRGGGREGGAAAVRAAAARRRKPWRILNPGLGNRLLRELLLRQRRQSAPRAACAPATAPVDKGWHSATTSRPHTICKGMTRSLTRFRWPKARPQSGAVIRNGIP